MAGSAFHPGVLEAQLLGAAAGAALADSASASTQSETDRWTSATVSGEPVRGAAVSVASISDALTYAHRSPAQSAVYNHQVRRRRERPSHACRLAHR